MNVTDFITLFLAGMVVGSSMAFFLASAWMRQFNVFQAIMFIGWLAIGILQIVTLSKQIP